MRMTHEADFRSGNGKESISMTPEEDRNSDLLNRRAPLSSRLCSPYMDDIRQVLTCFQEITSLFRRLISNEGVDVEILSEAQIMVSKVEPLVQKLFTRALNTEKDEEEEEEEAEEEGAKDYGKNDELMNNVQQGLGKSHKPEFVSLAVTGDCSVMKDVASDPSNCESVMVPTVKDRDQPPAPQLPPRQEQETPLQQNLPAQQPSDHHQQRFRIKSISNAIKPFTCSHCSQSFTQNKYLQQHIACRHEGVVNECPECKKHFSSVNNLNIHLQTHKEAREEFSCKLCDKVHEMITDFIT